MVNWHPAKYGYRLAQAPTMVPMPAARTLAAIPAAIGALGAGFAVYSHYHRVKTMDTLSAVYTGLSALNVAFLIYVLSADDPFSILR